MKSDDPPRRKRQRLPGFDYRQPGAYFVTVCVVGRRCLLGEIIDGVMLPSRLGTPVIETWRDMASMFPALDLDEFVLMPNHLHGVIGIRELTTNGLPEVMRVFKSLSTHRVNAMRAGGGGLWQRGYYEHVVRDDEDLDRIRRYIQDNPPNWAVDEENPYRRPTVS